MNLQEFTEKPTDKICPTCGACVKVVSDTTMHYESLDKKRIEGLEQMLADLHEDLEKKENIIDDLRMELQELEEKGA